MIAEARSSQSGESLPKHSARVLRRACVVGALAFLTLLPGQALAQSAADSATAQALFDRGKKLMAERKYAEACPALEESQRIEARSGTLLNLADCYEKSGRLASAWSTFLEAATSAKASGNTEREQGARARATALAPQLSNLVITAPSAAATPGLEITRDGVRVGSAQLGLPLPADAGPHTISAQAPGRKPWKTEAIVKGGASTASVVVPDLERVTAESALPTPAATQPAQPTPPVQPAQPAQPAQPEPHALPSVSSTTEADHGAPSRSNTAVIAGGVVTGALLVGTVVTSALYSGKLHDYNGANDQHASNAADLRSQTKTLGIANLVLLGGTVVAAGVTVYLWSRAHSEQAPESARLELRGFVSPGVVGVRLGGSL
jgi:hypothetical protein